jgi:hypothetical protein
MSAISAIVSKYPNILYIKWVWLSDEDKEVILLHYLHISVHLFPVLVIEHRASILEGKHSTA